MSPIKFYRTGNSKLSRYFTSSIIRFIGFILTVDVLHLSLEIYRILSQTRICIVHQLSPYNLNFFLSKRNSQCIRLPQMLFDIEMQLETITAAFRNNSPKTFAKKKRLLQCKQFFFCLAFSTNLRDLVRTKEIPANSILTVQLLNKQTSFCSSPGTNFLLPNFVHLILSKRSESFRFWLIHFLSTLFFKINTDAFTFFKLRKLPYSTRLKKNQPKVKMKVLYYKIQHTCNEYDTNLQWRF